MRPRAENHPALDPKNMNRPAPSTSRALLFGALVSATGLASAQAADYFLHQSQGAGWNWHQIGNNQGWYTARVGGAFANTVNGGVFDTAGDYYTNGYQVRSPESANEETFTGAKLILENNSSLALKTTNGTTARAVVPHLETQGSVSIIAANAGHYHNLTVTTFDQAGTTTFTANTGRSIDLTIGTLNGGGDIVFSGAASTSNFRLAEVGASSFTGTFTLAGGTLLFSADFAAERASLSIAEGAFVNLTHGVSVSALSIAGDSLADGLYSYSWLKQNYGDIFAEGDVVNGFISVGAAAIPEPSAFAAVLGLGAFGLVASRRRRR